MTGPKLKAYATPKYYPFRAVLLVRKGVEKGLLKPIVVDPRAMGSVGMTDEVEDVLALGFQKAFSAQGNEAGDPAASSDPLG